MSSTAEAPWNFERPSPGGDSATQAAHTLADKVKVLFSADGKVSHLVLSVGELLDRVQALTERMPDKDRDRRDLEDLIYRAAKAGAEYGGYREAPREPRERGPSWKERILTICGTLVVIGIPSLILMYGQLAALKSMQDAQQLQIAHQQAQIDQLTQFVMSRK